MKRAVRTKKGWLAGLLPLLFLAACGAPPPASSPSEPAPLVLESLQITPGSPLLPEGLTVQLSVSGRLSDGSQVDLSNVAVWASSDSAVAAVDNGGILAAVGLGSATVTATISSISAQTGVEVTAPGLLALDIEPPSRTLAKGLTTEFHAYGRYTDGSRREVTAEAVWSTASPPLAETSSTVAGRVMALTSGTTAVEAGLAGASATAALTVTDAALVGLEISPATTTLAKGTGTMLVATGLYSDNTSADISTLATWQSSDSAVAAVDGTGGVNGVSQGTAAVTAGLDGFSASTDVTVTGATLTSLDISPRNATVAAGSQVALAATGVFSNGTRQDLSGTVLWSSSDTGVAAIGMGTDGGAVVEALAAGAVQLAADLAGVHVATPLTVKSRALTAIHVTPSDPGLALGSTLILGARGDYDDGSSQTLADQVTWESQDTAVAVVDSEGMVTPVAPGSVRISASQGETAGSVLLTVTAATLDAIEVVFDNSTLAAGTHVTLAAIGHYSDGSTQDLTGQVRWTSSDGAVADVQAGTRAEVTARMPGSATLTARFGAVESQLPLTVSDAVLTSLDIGPAALSVVKGGELAFSALGQYSDGSTQDLTEQVTWSSADSTIAGVGNAAGESGRVSGVGSGSVAVTAALGGVSASTMLTVQDDPAAPVALTVVATPNVILGDGMDSATLTVTVLAAGAGAMVADGTPIQYQIMRGDGVLAAGTSTTTNGQASVKIKAVAAGLVIVEATVAGTAIGNDAAVYALNDFSEVLAVATPFSGTVAGGVVQKGARFGLFVFNLSNREFSLDRFRFYYAGEMGIDSGDPLRLNQNRLPGGTHVGAVVELANDFPTNGFSAEFLLSDPASGRNFSVEGAYSLSFP